MTRRKKKKGVNPVFAVVLFAGAAAVAANAFLGSGGTSGSGVDTAIDDSAFMVEDPEEAQPVASEAGVVWQDLLAVYGSFDDTKPVRVAFSVLAAARTITAAAPGGETAVRPTFWEGPDPPELRVGVVMISDQVQRAVLDGRVVGAGEEVSGVVVQSIVRDRIIGLWGTRVLTYDLEDGWPREFRPEVERRRQELAESEGDAGLVGAEIEVVGEEEGK